MRPFASYDSTVRRVQRAISARPGPGGRSYLLAYNVVELHTGSWCDAIAHEEQDRSDAEWQRLCGAAHATQDLGLECHAGHGLDYATARTIAALPQIVELNIGHFLIGEAVFVGLASAIGTMRDAIQAGIAA